jgi:hypothetical protein
MQRRFGWISKQDAAAGLLLVSSDMVGKGEERKWGIESRERSTWGGSRGPGAVGIYIAVGNFRKPNSTSRILDSRLPTVIGRCQCGHQSMTKTVLAILFCSNKG